MGPLPYVIVHQSVMSSFITPISYLLYIISYLLYNSPAMNYMIFADNNPKIWNSVNFIQLILLLLNFGGVGINAPPPPPQMRPNSAK